MNHDKTASLMASLTLGTAGGSAAVVGSGDNAGGGGGGDDQDLFGDIPIDDDPPPLAPTPAPAPFPAPVPPPTTLNGSVYHDPMSVSGMQQQQPNFPFPQPLQPLEHAPNITYAAPAPTPTNMTSHGHQDPVEPAPALGSPEPVNTTTTNNNMTKSLLLTSGLLGMAGGSSDEKKADLGGDGGGGGLFDDIDQEQQQREEEEARQKAAAAAAAALAEQKRQEEQAAAAAAAAAEQQRLQQEEQQRLLLQQQQQMQMQMQQQQQQPPQSYTLEQRMAGMHLNQGQNSYLQQSQQQQQQLNPAMMMNYQQPGQAIPGMNSPQRMMHQQQQQMPFSTDPMSPLSQTGPSQIMQPSMNHQPAASVLQPQQPPMEVSVPGITYRDHPGDLNSNMNSQQMQQGMLSPQQQQAFGPGGNASPSNRFYQPALPTSILAGMHNATPPQPPSPYGMPPLQQQQQYPQQRMTPMVVPITKPPDVPTFYGKVTCSDPMLLQAPAKLLGMVSSPPHWTYQFATQILGQPPGVWMVRRRFNHVVALEDRLRMECPGAILPPRPDKHVSRAIEEASTHQSAEFAWQRAGELERYLNALVVHPEVFASQSLRMFLGLQDDMGTAWPECSSNAFTRMSAITGSAANNASSGIGGIGGFFGSTAAPASTTPGQAGGVINNVIGSVANNMGVGELAEAVTEDSAELLALSSSESIRMGAILQAVPKLEGAVTLLREQGEGAGAVGMELNRLAKEVLQQGDRELAMPLEILSNGLLRYGRRTKRLGQEIGQATMLSFQMHYKLCRYEKLAWADRRNALSKRMKERGRADKRAQQLMAHQHQYGPQGGYGGGYGQGGGYGGQPNMMMNNQYNGGMQGMDHLMNNATMSDNMAVNAVRECEEIGDRLKREVNRVSFLRRMDWSKSMKVIASYMKEAAAERVAIWESTRDTFLQAFPEYHNDTSQWTNVSAPQSATIQGMPQQQLMQAQPQMMGQSQIPQVNINPGMNMNMNMNNSFMGPGAPMGMGGSYMVQQPQLLQQPQQFAHTSMMASGMIQQPQQPR